MEIERLDWAFHPYLLISMCIISARKRNAMLLGNVSSGVFLFFRLADCCCMAAGR